MTFIEWYNKNDDDLYAECQENNSFQELDFDYDEFCENKYEEYLKGEQHESKTK